MAWIVGIDEAGYGPSLGPFVMSLIACRVPEEAVEADLWQRLTSAVRHGKASAGDTRVLVDDSKVVHAGPNGLACLELGVLGLLAGTCCPATLHDYLAGCCAAGLDDLAGEPWYRGTAPVPCQAAADLLFQTARDFERACVAACLEGWLTRTVVVPTPSFNRLVEASGSKGAVLAHALAALVQQHRLLPGADPVHFFVDKHGGRNTYAAMLQHALGEGIVVAREEGALRSVYDVLGMYRPIRLTFQPRADAAHFCVALASMTAKYLRERLMEEFNTFWRQHLPELKPTAGYPGDAGRFFETIRPLLPRLGLSEAALWRFR